MMTTTYRQAGVDIDQANLFVERIKPLVSGTARKEVMGRIGGFGGLFHLDLNRTPDPVLVSSTDGVGTKLKIAQMMNRHDTIGIDLVAMCVNDVIVQGAEPLFFLDYLATGKIGIETGIDIVRGIVRGCLDAGCALIGGETAEMPGFYPEGEYDLAGFCVGVVNSDRIIDGSGIGVGDTIIGLASSGLHSNGYSLARKIVFDMANLSAADRPAGLDVSIGEELLKPTRIYVKALLKLIKSFHIKGLVHITGGGFLDNIPRIVPGPCKAVVYRQSWPVPPIFSLLRDLGKVAEMEMWRVFNMGVGMMIVVSEGDRDEVMERIAMMGEQPFCIGHIEKRSEQEASVQFTDP
ncbi:MAG TPA: phosphoribosylformylglycinamidine cyclo-ligase [Syntrophales bacterium]|jgi:phosphoribosylformylglycinamidine cyclo-ligase|nr:phosphoribosylformylglycinamidine cyclo-ligase [Syntrophales bacterium]